MSNDSKVHMDRISQLPDEIIHHILSCLPIKEAVRTSILSKCWNKVCRSYDFVICLYFDHNKFALRKFLSVETDGRDPDIREIRNGFTEFVTNELLNLSQQNSPVLKLVLDLAVIDDECECVNQLLELIMQSKVEELCLFVQTNGFPWDDEIPQEHICYDIPYEVLASSEWLQCLTLQGCKFRSVLNNDLGAISSLRSLLLSQVMVSDRTVLENLAKCCPQIELIEFDSCTLWMQSLDLEIFPKLKKASIVDFQYGELEVVDLLKTNLESFYCDTMECTWRDMDCRDKIRELTLISEYYPFNDLTAEAFPLAVNAKLMIYDVQDMVKRFEASSSYMETLDLLMYSFLEKLSVHCENLKHFNYEGHGFDNVHIDCPNLKRFNYLANEPSDDVDLATILHMKILDSMVAPFPKTLFVHSEKLQYFKYEGCGFKKVYINCSNLRQFIYSAQKLPDVLNLNLPLDIGCIDFRLDLHDNLDTSWFVHLGRFLEAIAGCEICLHLRIHSQMGELVPDEFGKKLAMLEQKKVHLIVELQCADMQNPAALLDGLLWSIHPTTLTIRGRCHSFFKALYEKLDSSTQDNPCCGHLRVCKFWWHNLVNGYLTMDIEDVKKKLTSMMETNESSEMKLCLKFPRQPNM